jgi:amino acid transporter
VALALGGGLKPVIPSCADSIATQADPDGLKRSLGMWDATALVIGAVIGVGIFRMPAAVAGQLHAVGLFLLAWLAGAAISFLGALCYAELGAAYPKTGGDYVYIQRAYGRWAGFLFGWTKVFAERIGTIAILAVVFSEYASIALGVSPEGNRWLAVFAIVGLTLANIVGIRMGKRIQNLLTIGKVACLIGMIAIGLILSWRAGSLGPQGWLMWAGQPEFWPSSIGPKTWQAFGVALVFVLWTYGGWTESAYVAEEIRNPARALPWSILLGLSIVTIIYLAINWVYILFIPLTDMAHRPWVASELMRVAWGPKGASVAAFMVSVSAFGALNAYILTGGRILMAMGKDHPIFERMAAIHPKFATPAKALGFNAVSAVLLLGLGSFEQIVTYSTVVISVFFTLTALAVIVLRLKEPDRDRPYRVWGYPITPILFAGAMGLFIANMVKMQPKESLLGFLVMAAGLPLFLISNRMKRGIR